MEKYLGALVAYIEREGADEGEPAMLARVRSDMPKDLKALAGAMAHFNGDDLELHGEDDDVAWFFHRDYAEFDEDAKVEVAKGKIDKFFTDDRLLCVGSNAESTMLFAVWEVGDKQTSLVGVQFADRTVEPLGTLEEFLENQAATLDREYGDQNAFYEIAEMAEGD